jgi:hypothetical protein
MDMKFGMWNARSLYTVSSLMIIVIKISKYRLDLVEVHVRWDRCSNEPAGKYTFFNERGIRIIN